MIDVKIDTKEKFSVITAKQQEITANMTDELQNLLISYLSKDIPHVILNMKAVQQVNDDVVKMIAGLHQQFYDKNASFIVCELNNEVEKMFEAKDLLETMNVTPTESEAWDIVQMEEIERELMRDFDNNEPD